MPELHFDLNRALSKAFVLSILGTMLCVLFGAFSDIKKEKYSEIHVPFLAKKEFYK